MSIETAARRVAYLIVAIVTKSDVYYAAVGKVLHVPQVVLYRKTVLYTYHQRFYSIALVAQQVLTASRQGDVSRVAEHNLVNLVEDKVGVSFRCVDGEWCYVGESFLRLRLWQICHHRHRVRPALVHFVQVVEHFWVAMVEAHALREEHRRVAV